MVCEAGMGGGSSVSVRLGEHPEPASRQGPERRTTPKFHAGWDNLGTQGNIALSPNPLLPRQVRAALTAKSLASRRSKAWFEAPSMPDRACPNGHAIPDWAAWCRRCGSRLDGSADQMMPGQGSALERVHPVLPSWMRMTAGPDTRAVRGCTVVGGYGLAFPTGTTGVFGCGPEGAGFWPYEGLTLVCGYDDVLGLDVGGPGKTRKGCGVIGGGFGLLGMLEGMVVASVLNRLMTKVEVNSLIALTMPKASLIVHTASATPAELKVYLAPIRGRVVASRARSGQSDPAARDAAGQDPLGQLERLKQLLDGGILNGEEYEQLRRKLVQGLLGS